MYSRWEGLGGLLPARRTHPQAIIRTHPRCVLLVLQAAMMVGGLVVRHRLFMQSKYHLTVQLLNVSIGLTLVANFLDLIHYLVFSGNGLGVPRLHAVSLVFTGTRPHVYAPRAPSVR